MAKSGVFLTFLGVVVCVQGRLFRTSPETCSTERTEMDITRTLTVTHEGVLKTVDCVARVSVNECEGSCLSTASPNVHTYPDFKKVKIVCKNMSLPQPYYLSLYMDITRCITRLEIKSKTKMLEKYL